MSTALLWELTGVPRKLLEETHLSPRPDKVGEGRFDRLTLLVGGMNGIGKLAPANLTPVPLGVYHDFA